MKKLLLLGLALLAVYMGGRAVKRNSEVLQLLWALVGMTALTGTANTPKARSTEDRLNNLIPVVFPNTGGTVNGSMTVTGTHTVGTQLRVNTTGGSAAIEVAGSGHVTGGLQVDGNHVVGGSVSASAGGSFGSNVHVTGGGTFTGDVILSGTLSSPGGQVTTNGNHAVTGRVTASAMTLAGSHVAPVGRTSLPGSPSSTYNSAWAASVTNIVTNIVNSLVSAGIFT
jgi:hypothetical protein